MPYSFELETHIDTRGRLIVINEFPFPIVREFKIYDVPPAETRGKHAHRECHQLLIAVTGTVIARLHDGKTALAYRLSSPSMALHIEPMIWGEFEFLPGAILQVFASQMYNPDDYIWDFNKFLALKGKSTSQPLTPEGVSLSRPEPER